MGASECRSKPPNALKDKRGRERRRKVKFCQFLSRVITGNETRCFQYDTENKRHPHGLRKFACRNHTQRSSHSSKSRVLFTLNSFHKAEHSTKLIVSKYSITCEKLYVVKGLTYGPATELSTMTILHFTRRFLSSSFWPKNPLQKWNTHLIPLVWLRMTFSCFQKHSLP
jgi:hypothetical protein